MKEKIKKNLIGFILGVITAFSISVIAIAFFPSKDVTYDNKESGLKSTNVQGAIDELYGVCFPPKAGDTILDNTDIVTSGDGLYEDEYEDGRYFYKGANPNNYVAFNGEVNGWRIISIEPDKTIKIIKDTIIGHQYIKDQYWDTSGSNNWARPASLNTYLNETYYNSLTTEAKNQIVSKDWNIGAITKNNNLATQINNEKSKTWNGKIALVTASEYIRTNSDKNYCGSFNLIEDNSLGCQNKTWMYNNDYWWTLSPNAFNTSYSFTVDSYGAINSSKVSNYDYAVRPALYLSSEVTLTGSGTLQDPYVVNS